LLQHSVAKLQLIKGPSIYDVHTEGEGGQAQVDACGRGEGDKTSVDVKQRIRAHWHHLVFFSCKEVGVFWTRVSSWDWNKSRNFSSI